MWILAVLSVFVFWINAIVFPLGPVFAFCCWRVTEQPLQALANTGSPARTEMWAARVLALVLASMSVLTAIRMA
jgi:hypothetical protein